MNTTNQAQQEPLGKAMRAAMVIHTFVAGVASGIMVAAEEEVRVLQVRPPL